MTPDQNNGDRPIINVEEEIQSNREKARATAKQQLFTEKKDREAAEFEEDIDSKYQVLGRIRQYKEVLSGEPESVEELITALQQTTFEDLKKAEREKKYGRGTIGKVKSWLAGEYDVKVSENEVRGSSNFFAGTRKFAQTFINKKNVAAAATSVGIGILTGGAGFAATGVIAGSSVGRLTAEALTYGKEMQARKEVLLAEKERWYQLKELALEYDEAEEMEEKTNIVSKIVDIYHEQGESAVIKQLGDRRKALAETREGQDKLRHRLQIAGGIIGGGAGVASEVLSGNVTGGIDIDLLGKDARGGMDRIHEVVKVDDQWRFLYSEAEKVAGIGGGLESNVLGDPIWLGSNQADIALATTIQRTVPVLATAWAGSILADKVGEAGARKKELKKINRSQEIADKLKVETPAQAPEARKESNRSEPSPEEEEDEENIRDLFEQSKNPFPEVGQLWNKELSEEEIRKIGDGSQDDKLNTVTFRVESVDRESGQVEIAYLNGEKLFIYEDEPVFEVTSKDTVSLSELADDIMYREWERVIEEENQEEDEVESKNQQEKPNPRIGQFWLLPKPQNMDLEDLGINDTANPDDPNLKIPVKIDDIDEKDVDLIIYNPITSEDEELSETGEKIVLPINVVLDIGIPYSKSENEEEEEE